MATPTLISPYGYDASTCGYCSPSGSRSAAATSRKYAFEGSQMSVKFYQDIIDRGWRRSGDFVYRPDIARSCCPQYTIRLDARHFKPNKKHRQVINRWNRYLATGSRNPDAAIWGGGNGKGKGKGKAKGAEEDWISELHRWEIGTGQEGAVKFETVLAPATATEETFELYKKYQVAVHNDPPGKVTMRGFKRFLCDSPLIDEPIPYKATSDLNNLPDKYGSYHLLFKANSKIIGISVIDILPNCVSSVYFIWDPDWAWSSLGKLSAMFEASLARRIAEQGGGGGYVYMGYWIANCQKMRYKSDYSPSYLLDPGTNVFHPLTSTLDKYLTAHPRGSHPFADILTQENTSGVESTTAPKEEEDEQEEALLRFPSPPPPGSSDPAGVSDEIVGKTLVLHGGARGQLIQFKELRFRDTARVKQSVKELYAALGEGLIAIMGKGLEGVKDKGILTFG